MRGIVLRFVKRRALATALGIVLAVPGGWVQLTGRGDWWAEGLSLIALATGIALIWTGLAGLRPDWVDDE